MSSITLKAQNKLPEEQAISDKTKKEHQKLLAQLLKVHNQESNCNTAFGRIRELRHNATETEPSLSLTPKGLASRRKFALNGIAISFIFTLLLDQLWCAIGWSSTQRWCTNSNSSFFTPSSISSGAINLVDMK